MLARHLISLATYDTLSDSERLRLAEEVASRLGDLFAPMMRLFGKRKLAAVEHREARVALLIVPGGRYVMGLRGDDIAAVTTASAASGAHDPVLRDALDALEKRCRPTREVEVKPFLCSGLPLMFDAALDLLPAFEDEENPFWGLGRTGPEVTAALNAEEAQRVLELTGFRVMMEREWEYVAREGGPVIWVNDDRDAPETMLRTGRPPKKLTDVNGLGFLFLERGEWVGDRWRDSYAEEEAPASPCPETIRGASRLGFPWQERIEALLCLCAARTRPEECGVNRFQVRFAYDIPVD